MLDVFTGDPAHGAASRAALGKAIHSGELVACEVVWAETAACFPDAEAAASALDRIPVLWHPLERRAALLAGSCWREYRRRGGSRERVVADFLIGAHASTQADRLLTRDRGFYRNYFRGLTLFEPER